jgi:SAM-dependent methyltransferase
MDVRNLFSDNSDEYAKARPRYPKGIYEYLSSQCPEKKLAWDCACGNGQVAADLIQYFDRVEATDASQEQIAEALKVTGVQYLVSDAESTPFVDQSFDLICVAQALHWFNLEKFWSEVERVLKPGGVFATWGYNWPSINLTHDQVLDDVLLQPIEPYWAEQNKLLWDHYLDVELPYTPLSTPEFKMKVHMNLHEYFEYLCTWSATKRCRKEQGDEFLRHAFQALNKIWGDANQQKQIVMDFCFLVSRK